MKGQVIRYTQAELAWIEAHRTMPRAQAHAAFVAQFGRHDVSAQNFAALCKRKGWLTGRDGRFTPGQPAMNKGKAQPFHPNSARTRFQPGTVPPNRKPLWHERIGKDGYIEIKVPVENPYTGHATRYMHKHRWCWEQVNGPLPRGMALKCLDGERTNTDPSNWRAVPRALLPRLNGRGGRDYDSAPEALKPALLATALLEHQARKARRNRRAAPADKPEAR